MCSGGNILTRQCVPGETYLLGNVLFPVIPALPPRRFLLELLHAMLSHVHRLWVSNFNIENRNRIKWHFNSTYLCSSGSLLSWIALRKFEKKKDLSPEQKPSKPRGYLWWYFNCYILSTIRISWAFEFWWFRVWATWSDARDAWWRVSGSVWIPWQLTRRISWRCAGGMEFLSCKCCVADLVFMILWQA